MEQQAARAGRGVASSLGASLLFGGIFYIAGVVDASPGSLFGWRTVVTAVAAVLVLVRPSARVALFALLETVRSSRWAAAGLLCTSGLLGVQMWLFAWAPARGHALDASVGYLLLPLVLVVVGRAVFGDRVSRAQWLAVGVAAAGVVVKLVVSATLSWVTLAVCLGYAAYFTLRRHQRLDLPATFGAEVVLASPVAIVMIGSGDGASPGALAVTIAAGIVGAVAMWAYLTASRILSMPVFGLLTYVEPLLLVAIAFVLGERPAPADAAVYGLLGVALLVLATGALRRPGWQRPRTRRLVTTSGRPGVTPSTK